MSPEPSDSRAKVLADERSEKGYGYENGSKAECEIELETNVQRDTK